MNYRIMGYFLATLLISSTSVYAQDEAQSVDDTVTKMTTELNLTESQADAIKPIIKEYMAKRATVLQEAQGQAVIDHIALQNSMMVLRQNEYQKLSKVLSEDQMKRWVQKENLRAALNRGGNQSQVEEGITLTPSGANMKF